MKQQRWFGVALALLAPWSAAAEGETFDWWVDLRGSLTASIPDLEHPGTPSGSEGASVLSSSAPVGGVLYAPPERLGMDDRLAGDLAWARGLILAGGLDRPLPGQGSLELLLGLHLDVEGRTVALRDQGTRLRLGWPIWRGRLVLELLPFGSDRFSPAEGASTDWGGLMELQLGHRAPAAQLAHFGARHELFLGLEGGIIDKTVEQGSEQDTEKRGSYLVSLGGAFRLGDWLRLHLIGAHTLAPPTFARAAVRGEPAPTRGATLGFELGSGPLPPARGQRLPLLDEPALTDTFFPPTTVSGSVWWSLRGEWSWLQQQVEDADRSGETLWQPAWTVAAVARGGWRGWSLELGYLDESVSFVTHPNGGLVPFVGLAASMEVDDGHRGWLEIARDLREGALSAGLALGIRRPASATAEAVTAGPNPGDLLTGRRTVLVRSAGNYWVLPEGEDPVLELDARAELVWRITDALVLGSQVYLRQNGNRAAFTESASGETIAVFADPFSVGLNLALRFRFAADSTTVTGKGKNDGA